MTTRRNAVQRMAAQQVPDPAELDRVAPAEHRLAVRAQILTNAASDHLGQETTQPQPRRRRHRPAAVVPAGSMPETSTAAAPVPLQNRRPWPAVLAAAGVVVVSVVAALLSAVVPGAAPASAAATDTLARAAAAAIGSQDEPVGPGQLRYVGTRAWYLADLGGAPGGPYRFLQESVYEVWVPADPTGEWLLDRRSTGQRQWIEGNEEQARAAGIPLEEMGPPTERIAARCGDFYPSDEGADPCTVPGSWQTPTEGFLDGLPRDPAALLDRLRRDAPENGGGDAGLLVYAADLLRTGLVPADLRSALYSALSRLDGLTLTEGALNLDGRFGTALGIDGEFDRQEIIVDPATGVFIGERQVSIGSGDGLPAGAVRGYTSVHTAVVDTLGTLPPQ